MYACYAQIDHMMHLDMARELSARGHRTHALEGAFQRWSECVLANEGLRINQSEGAIGFVRPERFGVRMDFRPHWGWTGGDFHAVPYPSVSADVDVRDR